jgi:tRNA(adenine34) deaminase
MFQTHRSASSGPSPSGGADPDEDVLDAWLIGEALALARRAELGGEVPIGAVVWRDGAILGRGSNRPITSGDPTAHAEIVAIREAAATAGNYRLTGAVLAVTLEPCLMCFGAALNARLERVVFGASDPRLGAAERALRLQQGSGVLNHRLRVTPGVQAQGCAELLRAFFAARR